METTVFQEAMLAVQHSDLPDHRLYLDYRSGIRRNDSPLLEMVNNEVKNQAESGLITTSLDHDSVQITDSIGYFRLFPLFPSANVCLHHLR